MLAVIQIGGHQYIVSQDDTFRVDGKISAGGTVTCDKVLLVTESDGKSFQVGMPYIDGMVVECKVVGHGKSKKVRVFKMQPKKRLQKTYGHRQDYVDLQVVKIGKGVVKQKVESGDEKAGKAPKVVKPLAVKKVAVKKVPVRQAAVKKSSVTKKTVAKKAS